MTWQCTVTIDPTTPDPDQPGATIDKGTLFHFLIREPQVQECIKRVADPNQVPAALNAAIAIAQSVRRKVVVQMTGHSNPGGKPSGGMSRDFVRLEAVYPEDG